MATIADLDPGRLFVLPLGVGGAFTRIHFHTSLLLFAEGRAILVDTPAPLRRILRDAGETAGLDLDVGDIEHILLTHLHGDHCNGLEEASFYKRYVLRQDRPHLYVLPELEEPLWEQRLRAAMGIVYAPETGRPIPQSLNTYFHVHPWDEGMELRLGALVSELRFRIRRTEHFVPCFGMKVYHGGFVFGYSADTGFDPDHIDFLSEADLIIHEVGSGGGHTPLKQLEGLPAEIRSKMLLIHAPDDLWSDPPSIPLALEGHLYEVGKGVDPVGLSSALSTPSAAP